MLRANCRQQVLTICVVVALSTAYLWCKVELASAAATAQSTRLRHQALVEEKSRQVAAIALMKKPSAMTHLAQRELHMIHPTTTLDLELPRAETED